MNRASGNTRSGSIRPRDQSVFGTGDRVNLSSIKIFKNRPAYFADWSVSTHELIEILMGLKHYVEWTINRTTLNFY